LKRREFITLLGGAAAAWPRAASAQQGAMPVIGFLNGQSAQTFAHLVGAFRQGLTEAGYVEGQNIAIEFRWANGDLNRLPELADQLVRRPVAVLVATGGADSVVKTASSTIPIIFTTGGEPVRDGLVASFNRPGGNATGVSVFSAVEAKRLELLHELVPKAAVIGVLLDPRLSYADLQLEQVQAAERATGLQIHVLNVITEAQIDEAFTTLVEKRVGAVAVLASPFLNSRRSLLVALAARHALPGMYETRDFAEAGGLMSYGASIREVYRQVGTYTGRILKGETPANLPILQPTKFELVINLKTAKTLGLTVPDKLLALADEVIE
jgi:putative tryptophan/tyrosine transport system substrate-binding protein